MKNENITIVGMTGVGKSTVGKLLAQSLGWEFVDIDQELEKEYQKPLQVILDELGDEEFQKVESKKIIEIGDVKKTIISPGGSIIYSPDAMKFLKVISIIIYLSNRSEVLKDRVNNKTRGIVGIKEKSFDQLLEERKEKYKNIADYTYDVYNKDPEQVTKEILEQIKSTLC